MTRLNVYVPDELATAAKLAGLNLSAVTQAAIKATLSRRSTDSWLAGFARRSTEPATHDQALEALNAARDEAPTRHG